MSNSWINFDSIISLNLSARGIPPNLYLDGENDVLTVTDTSTGYSDNRLSEFKNNFWILESATKDNSTKDKFETIILC